MGIYMIWSVICVIMMIFGICAWISKSPVRFWNVGQEIQVSNIKKYNRAVAKLWVVFAAGFEVIGLPIMGGQNSAGVVITILGAMFLSIALMIAYTRIEKKYRVYYNHER